MPSAWITKSTASEIQIGGSLRRTYDMLNDPRFQNVNKTIVAAALKAVVQADIDDKDAILVRDLPDDERYKTEDPEPRFGERMFWRGRGRNKELVARDTIVEDVRWDGDRYVTRLRRAR